MTDVALDRGLSSAEVAERVARGEVNTAAGGSGRSVAGILKANLLTRFNALIGALAVLVLIFGAPIDAAFGLIIVANSAIGVVQELRAKRTLDRLSIVARAPVRIRRDGVDRAVPPEELVVGDLILLGPGDRLAVDTEVVAEAGLEVDESLLTGEADPVVKPPGTLALSGSFVAAGTGTARTIRVGAASYAATLAGEASRFSLADSELRRGIDRFLRLLTWIIVPVGVLLVVRQLTGSQPFAAAVVGSVAGVEPMIPNGLVLMTSIAFAVGVIRLGRRRCLVQELPAVEVLARVDTLCLDKTGTLTEPGMSVREIAPDDEGVREVLAALVAADPRPNPTLAAIGAACGPSPGWTPSATLAFSSARKYSGAEFAGRGAFLLGAADVLLPADDPTARRAAELSRQGLRVLAVARARDLHDPDRSALALVVLEQTVRPTAAATLRYFADQGVAVKVISGDSPLAVGAIAARLGLGDGPAVDARDLPVDGPELAAAVERASVFGRVTPQQKRAMVHALRAAGHTVAMTGDGVNDVLALKDADLGIAMGSGSAASRAVAKVVLLDDEFAALPAVLAEGRRVLANIERVANLFLTKTVYSILLALAIGVVGLPFPFLPRHVTIVASLTIGIPGFFLALAPSSERARPGFVPRVLRFAGPAGAACAAATFVAYWLARVNQTTGLDEDRATATLTLFLVSTYALVLVAMPLNRAKRVLIGLIVAAFAALCLWPYARHVASLDFASRRNDLLAVAVAAVACLALRLVLRVSPAASRATAALSGRPGRER